MKTISDSIIDKLISFEPNINPISREEIIDFFQKERKYIREDHIDFLMKYGSEPSPICFKEACIICSFEEIKGLIDEEKDYGKEIPDGFSYFGSFFPEEPIILIMMMARYIEQVGILLLARKFAEILKHLFGLHRYII